jgi:hypothetical protein
MQCTSRLVVVAFMTIVLTCAACAEGARFTELDEAGGVIVYPLKKDRESIYSSKFRAEALKMMADHCPRGYRIIREGETQGQTTNTGRDDDAMLTTRRFWGFQFQCKTS